MSGFSQDYNYENELFVSYAWGGESERLVDELEEAFDTHGIRLIRDKKELTYKGSIEEFEHRIGRGHCVVLVISDKYLRSEHCMYELVKADENQRLRERIFPIVLAEARIYRAIDRLAYINHWDEQIEQLNQAIKNVSVMTNLPGIIADLDKYARIRASVDHLTDLLSDMNTLTPEIHVSNGFSTLINAVQRAMVGPFGKGNSHLIRQIFDGSQMENTQKSGTEDQGYWTSISDKFTQNIEKELTMNKPKYFRSRIGEVDKKPENYLALMYFPYEVNDMRNLSKHLGEIYDEMRRKYLTSLLEEKLNESLKNLTTHRDLTSDLISAALASDPDHSLGKSLIGMLQDISKCTINVQLALSNRDKRSQISLAVAKLRQSIDSTVSCMEELNRDFQSQLSSGSHQQ